MRGNWDVKHIPDLTGKIAVVTGGNIGLGFESVKQLAKRGAHVVIACRSAERGNQAIKALLAEQPGSNLDVIPLDLCCLASINRFGKEFHENFGRLDILLNNAGVVNLESLQRSAEGHEMHMATNHLGHFALTGVLLPAIQAADQSRVVTVSSLAHRDGVIDFEDFDWRSRNYSRLKAYGDSKLANLLFSVELQRRFDKAGTRATSVAAHPGLTGTERQQSIGIGGKVTSWLASPVPKGCRPQLLAATSDDIVPGGFYGPRFGIGGAVRELGLPPGASDEKLAARLWRYSEKLTGVSYRLYRL